MLIKPCLYVSKKEAYYSTAVVKLTIFRAYGEKKREGRIEGKRQRGRGGRMLRFGVTQSPHIPAWQVLKYAWSKEHGGEGGSVRRLSLARCVCSLARTWREPVVMGHVWSATHHLLPCSMFHVCWYVRTPT